MDISDALAPKSDQLDAVDLLGAMWDLLVAAIEGGQS